MWTKLIGWDCIDDDLVTSTNINELVETKFGSMEIVLTACATVYYSGGQYVGRVRVYVSFRGCCSCCCCCYFHSGPFLIEKKESAERWCCIAAL